jgi:hypothetical protein
VCDARRVQAPNQERCGQVLKYPLIVNSLNGNAKFQRCGPARGFTAPLGTPNRYGMAHRRTTFNVAPHLPPAHCVGCWCKTPHFHSGACPPLVLVAAWPGRGRRATAKTPGRRSGGASVRGTYRHRGAVHLRAPRAAKRQPLRPSRRAAWMLRKLPGACKGRGHKVRGLRGNLRLACGPWVRATLAAVTSSSSKIRWK